MSSESQHNVAHLVLSTILEQEKLLGQKPKELLIVSAYMKKLKAEAHEAELVLSQDTDGTVLFHGVRLKEVGCVEIDTNPLDTQVGGDHYKKLGQHQPWEVLAKWMTPDELRGFAKGTVVAYLARERDKGGIDDIRKAKHTLEIYLELHDRGNET